MAVDLIIIGTGLYGIQAARYYLEIHPDAQITLLEADSVPAGTWSSKRVYVTFWTQTPVKMAEFSDRPMPHPPPEDQYWGFFQGKHMTKYLESYLDDHVYAGHSLRDRIVFDAPVDRVTRSESGWRVSFGKGKSMLTKKLIDATGMTSQPNIPHLNGIDTFQGTALHHKDFGLSTFLSDSTKKHIVILGGAKSATDVAYAAAKADNKKVSWIIREDGSGPAAFFATQPSSPRYANSNEGFYNRFMASYLPNLFGRGSLLAWFRQRTWLGRRYLMDFWGMVDGLLRGLVDYGREEGKEMGFKNLEPDTPIFWQNDSSSVNNRPDLLSTIATKVHVYRQNVQHISENTITLAPKDGSGDAPVTFPVDVLVYCTGWTPTTEHFDAEEAVELGLPVAIAKRDDKLEAHWQQAEDAADVRVLRKFPHLAHPPPYHQTAPSHTPVRLYKAMAPLPELAAGDDSGKRQGTHSLAFLGRMVVGNNFCTAEAQALWAVAYLDGHIPDLPSAQTAFNEVAETVAWDRRRYLNKGQLGTWVYFDVVDYTDMLLQQLGLSSHRRKGWWGNLVEPCFARDLRGLVDEYKANYPTN